MNRSQQAKFDTLHRKHINALRRQGKAEKTVEAYSQVRSLPNILSLKEIERLINGARTDLRYRGTEDLHTTPTVAQAQRPIPLQ